VFPRVAWPSLGGRGCYTMNLETKLAAYIISSLFVVRYNKLPTKLLYRVESIVGPSSFFLNFVPRGI
jgi:hypothetical protein